jgi:hypothetical protein
MEKHMRSMMTWAVGIVALGGLLGCGGGQPEVYRVALETAPLNNLATTCYRSGQAPNPNEDQTRNLVGQQQWVLWDGVEKTKYLEVPDINVDLGQAERVSIDDGGGNDVIQAVKNDDGKYVFTAERVQVATDFTLTATAVYSFEDLGGTAKGSLTLRSTCAGTGCTNRPSCETTLGFVGRRIKVDPEVQYGNGAD